MVTERFKDRLGRSHTVVSRAWVFYDNELAIDEPLPAIDGSVTIDITRAVRRDGSVKILGLNSKYLPKKANDRLTPYGTELLLERGMVLDDQEVLVPIGRLRISERDILDDGRGITVDLSGYDRSRSVARARFTRPYLIERGTNTVEAITTMLQNRMPGVDVQADVSDATTPLLVIERQTDPWAKATEMAQSIGMDLYFDSVGKLQLRRIQNFGDPIERYEQGAESRIGRLSNRLSDDPGWNGVIVEGNPPGEIPVWGEAWDETPGSVTNRFGPYGEVPMFYTSEMIATQVHADNAAFALLSTELGGTEQNELQVLPDPTRDGNQVLEIVHEELGINDTVLTSAVKMPLALDQWMDITTRSRRGA